MRGVLDHSHKSEDSFGTVYETTMPYILCCAPKVMLRSSFLEKHPTLTEVYRVELNGKISRAEIDSLVSIFRKHSHPWLLAYAAVGLRLAGKI